ncbi:MAG TPA: ABC transporter permease [Trebonia sp.]|jgi:oleandomycin transport system permease protein|nr:ABC transporter permease [Trebonia sp.]
MSVMSLAPARRLRPVTAVRNSLTLTWRSVLKLRTNPEDLFGLLLQPIMYLVLFTYVFGGSIAGGPHKYLQFSLPGILVLSVVFATLGTGMMLSQDVATGVFDRFRALPIARWAPLAGAILGDMVRYVISVAVTLGFGFVLGFRIQTSPFDAAMGCLLVILFAVAMCWFSAMVGMLVKSAQGVQLWGFLLMFPLVFGSDILTQEAKMPGWLQAFVNVNPVTYLTEAERALLAPVPGGPAAATVVVRSLLWALGIFVVFAPLAVAAYRRRTAQ